LEFLHLKPERKEQIALGVVPIRDRPIWLFGGRYWYVSHSWTDSR